MSDINLFKIDGEVKEMPATSVVLEKELQSLIENNMEEFFGVRFLASEYAITNGRMDSIGIDENNCPVIIEYKRSINENVINQGLFYLDWLLDHKANFELLVMRKLGNTASENIDWSVPCVICIANDFTKYDIHAVNQMQKNIKLVKYAKFGTDLILFEHLNVPLIKNNSKKELIILNNTEEKIEVNSNDKISISYKLENANEKIKNLYFSVRDYALSKGEDISENVLKHYVAFKRVKNFMCVQVFKNEIALYLKLDPSKEEIINGFTRDMTNIGHYGTGNLEVVIKNEEDYKKAKPLVDKAYDLN